MFVFYHNITTFQVMLIEISQTLSLNMALSKTLWFDMTKKVMARIVDKQKGITCVAYNNILNYCSYCQWWDSAIYICRWSGTLYNLLFIYSMGIPIFSLSTDRGDTITKGSPTQYHDLLYELLWILVLCILKNINGDIHVALIYFSS